MKQLKARLQKLLSNSWFIALIITLIIIISLQEKFNKYRSELIETGYFDKPGGLGYWADINKDGNSELIVLFNNTEGKASLKFIDQQKFILGHHYFNGTMIPQYESFGIGSIDSTGRLGMALLTIKNDSILLHVSDPFPPGKVIVKDKLIARTESGIGQNDFSVGPIFFCDLESNNHFKLIFQIMAGFSLKPRQIFVYDLETGQLISTKDNGWLLGITEIKDINGDSKREILLRSYAVNNYSDSVKSPGGDHSAWFAVLDNNLQFIFSPLEFPGQYQEIKTFYYPHNKNNGLLVIKNRKTHSNERPRLSLYEINGKIKKIRDLDEINNLRMYNLYLSMEEDRRLFLIRENGYFEELNENLSVRKRFVSDKIECVNYKKLDLDNDGSEELIFANGKIHPPSIARADLTAAIYLPTPVLPDFLYLDKIQKIGARDKLFIQRKGQYFICSYEISPWYYLRWFLYFIIFVSLFLFSWLIRFIQRRSLNEKYEAEKKIAEMQLLLIKNQIDPHFTFNAINAISASILQKRPEEANENMLRLSRLMRASVEHADQLSRTLAEELDFIRNYLDLMKERMQSGFDYTITIREGVDSGWLVPKMIMQIYVENAVKHGIRPLKEGGNIGIMVSRNDHSILIGITDNGVGVHQAKKNGSDGTGKGMKIMDQFIETFNRFNTNKIRVTITDLKISDSGSSGTEVRLTIPIGLKYSFHEK